MRTITFISLFFISLLNVRAQKYGNEWINFSQQYFKFPIYKEGIYRIDSTTLASNFNLASINPKNFQLFIKGKEQFIFIEGESDNQINSNDYLEFYANPLMGDLDSSIYHNIKYTPNPYAPIFNDTLYAFLSLSNSISNKRFVLEMDTNSVAYQLGDHFYSEKLELNPSVYNPVFEYTPDDGSDPRYTQAEGRGTTLNYNTSISSFFSPLNTFTASPLPVKISINCSGMSRNFNNNNDPDHRLTLKYNDASNTILTLMDTLFYAYAPIRKTFTLNSQTVGSSSNFTLSSAPSALISSTTNVSILHYLHIFYPQVLELNSASFYKLYIDDATTSTKTFYKFSNFNFSGSNAVLFFDLSNGKKIKTVIANTKVRAVIPNGNGRKLCVMMNEADTIQVKKLIKVNETGYFSNFKSSAANYPFVIIYHKSLLNSATAYVNYRKSAAGGSYDVIPANISELYEQFAFGVNKHPAAIRNYLKYLNDSLSSKPLFVLLIGKGVKLIDMQGAYQDQNLIPTMGIPSSDHLLTAALSSTYSSFVPEIPIGRLAAIHNNEVTAYLNKVQQHESSGTASWKKRVLHFIGADDEALLNTVSNYMDEYKQTIKDTLFGAEVILFKKNTTAPIQTNLSDSIFSMISNGTALMNYFGHGATQNLAIAIADPEVFNNQGKYPFFIANSCYSGNIFVHALDNSVSQKYVFANQKGSIGYIATTSLSYDNRLHAFTKYFYRAFSRTHYNQPIGHIIKEACRQNSSSFDSLTRFIGLQEILHGDPSVRVGVGNLPDYELKNSTVRFDTKSHADSIGIRIKISNLGLAKKDSFFVNVNRYFPNGDTAKYMKRIAAPYFKDSLGFFMPIDFNRGVGLNKFTVKIDDYNEIAESNEGNNSTVGTLDLIIAGNDLLPVYPFNYGIVPKTPTITLKASTSDPFAPEGNYLFQLDTCDRFLSPIQSTKIMSRGGVLEWIVNLPYKDSTVYFWRVSRDSISATSSFLWKESSFQTIGSKRGWSQAHFQQFKNDAYQFVKHNKNLRKFEFLNTTNSIFCRNGFYSYTAAENINYFFNELVMSSWTCGPDGWNFAVFDSISGQPQVVKDISPVPSPGIYNNCVCVDYDLYFYSFGANNYCGTPNWATDMENFINAIAPNNYVLAFSVGSAGEYVQIKTKGLAKAFESLGANELINNTDSVPRILFGKKGMTRGQAHETLAPNKETQITQRDSITTRWNSGYIASEIIGPANSWKSLHWRIQSIDNSAGDTSTLKLIGIKADGQADTLQSFSQDSVDISSLGAYIQAQTYPYLKLVAYLKDSKHATAPQLKRWQVIYDEAAECAFNPLKGFKALNDTLMEGDEVRFVIPIENIGSRNFDDSLVITYWLEDAKLQQTPLSQKLIAKPFIAGQLYLDTVKVNSYKITGDNALWIYANPNSNSKYQIETHQFNNIGRFPFKVNQDITNPLMDVTFDGVRILNGDLVSAQPNILISLKDENKFLVLNDTSAFKIFIQAPDQSQPRRLYFGEHLEFEPASLPKNSCSIQYHPSFYTDGKYTLIAQATDRSNNKSGSIDYKVQFEIKTKATITNVLNYPNPFSTSTRFVFTLTGSEVPEVFTIQIMTITGKIVREITMEEIGNLHIGRNITEYAWDGKDMVGDRLGNGVYLYRVITKLNGNNIEKNSSSADQYFVKDFGKMVLMR